MSTHFRGMVIPRIAHRGRSKIGDANSLLQIDEAMIVPSRTVSAQGESCQRLALSLNRRAMKKKLWTVRYLRRKDGIWLDVLSRGVTDGEQGL